MYICGFVYVYDCIIWKQYLTHWFNKAKKKSRWRRYLWMLGINEVM